MTPINNSDTAWLIVSDYNQDNDKFYEDLREDIYNPNINEWNYEFHTTPLVGTNAGRYNDEVNTIGGWSVNQHFNGWNDDAGDISNGTVGGLGLDNTAGDGHDEDRSNGHLVGGNYYVIGCNIPD